MAAGHGPRKPPGGEINSAKLDALVSKARKDSDARMLGYREQSLRLHPQVCGRCGREFTRANLHELTVHHKDHNHDNNPPDGSNWENLCLYCHDAEHQRFVHLVRGDGAAFGLSVPAAKAATHQPFAALKDLLKREE